MTTAVEMEAGVRHLMQANKLQDAAAACDQLNQQHPDYVAGWATASRLAMCLKEPIIAVRAIDRALQLAPGRPALLVQRIDALMAAGDQEHAVKTAKQVGEFKFESGKVASKFGLLLSRLKLHQEARIQFQHACEMEPDEGQHYYNLATVERFLGNLDDAERAVDRCIEFRPADADAHLLRSSLRTQTNERNNINSLLDAHTLTRKLPRDRLRICFALFKEFEDLGDYSRAFEFLQEGSGLRRENMQYTPENDLETMREIRATYACDVFEQKVQGHISAEPIFIVGMPRTGTTLVERILSSHSVVRSVGESQAFSVELMRLCRNVTTEPPKNARDLVHLSANVDFVALGENYLNAARPAGPRDVHFVDKLPFNFLYAGLIHLALPKAKIILLERDPMDTCFAVYKTLFEGVYPFSYDLEELANYFVEFRRLIAHWHAVMPGVIHVVRYEDLVTNPQPVIEDLLQHCNLSFEDGCREFFKSKSASTTASAVQVRSDVYSTSVGRWRSYEEQLKSVADILENAQ